MPLLVLPLAELFQKFRSFRIPARGFALVIIGLSLVLQLASVSVDPYRFWHGLINYRMHEGQAWVWEPGDYNYYWSRNPMLDPELFQFVTVRNVVQYAVGDKEHAVRPKVGLGPPGTPRQQLTRDGLLALMITRSIRSAPCG